MLCDDLEGRDGGWEAGSRGRGDAYIHLQLTYIYLHTYLLIYTLIYTYSWLDGHEFEKPLGVGDGQGGLASYSPWDCKKSDTTGRLNNNKRICNDNPHALNLHFLDN